MHAGSLVAAMEFNGRAMAAEQFGEGDRDVEEAPFIVGLAQPNGKVGAVQV